MDGKRKQKQKLVQHAEQRVEQQTNRKAKIVRWTIALSGPERSGDNRQHAEQRVEQQTNRKRNRQHAEQRVEQQTNQQRNRQRAEQHVEHLTSKIS